MIRRPPRSTLSSSSAASDVYKRQRRVSNASNHLLAQNEFSGLEDSRDLIKFQIIKYYVHPIRATADESPIVIGNVNLMAVFVFCVVNSVVTVCIYVLLTSTTTTTTATRSPVKLSVYNGVAPVSR